MWVFGSVVRPWFHEGPDLDLAAEGISPSRRTEAWDRVATLANTAVDLVHLEETAPLLRARILADGELV